MILFFVNMPIQKSAGAIIFRRDQNKIKYLLIKYELGHWEFTRGLIEKGEKIEDTAKREIEEEVGIKDIKFIPGFKEWFKFFYKREGENIMKIVTFLLAKTKTKDVKLSFEHSDYKWLDYDQALKLLTYDNSKEIFKKAHKFLLKNEKF